jgi:hypothetical protein
MHRSFLKVVACVTVSACARSVPPAVTPAPAPSSDVSVVPATPAPLPAAPDRNTSREFRGAYTRGFEASWFSPCDAPMDDALWWVTLTEAARLQRDSLLKTLTSAPTGALAVRWKGTISARMPAGQLGRGTRYMLVTEILEVRPLPGEGACSPASRAS